jgi:hypothetical protein
MEHVGIVVDDLEAATEFFVRLGLVVQGEATVEGDWVDRVVGLEGVRVDIAMMQTPDGNGRLELTKYCSPPNQGDKREDPANARGIRHVALSSMTSTESSPGCERGAPNSSVSWSASRIGTGSATFAVRRESSSS